MKVSSHSSATIEADPRWAAVRRRDGAFDGQFFYSVKTSGVYCLPSCAARQANPKNVAFHASRAKAEAAGFRPCKRCRPDLPPLKERHAAMVADICRRIEASDAPPRLGELAKTAGLSLYHFHRVFKAATGLTPGDYAQAHRAGKIRKHLKRSNTVTHAIFDSGFQSSSRFYAKSGEMLGMSPSRYRAGGKGEAIRFAVGQSALGAVLVAQSGKGVCAILLGDNPEMLVRDLEDRFPRAQLLGGDTKFEKLVAQVIGFIEAPGKGLDLPLDVQGTAFQQKVWKALRRIPAGKTVSYADIARAIGAPRAVRAVASACAGNRLAVAIPCHRVVRQDGGLSGYRWGVERKRELLARESKAA